MKSFQQCLFVSYDKTDPTLLQTKAKHLDLFSSTYVAPPTCGHDGLHSRCEFQEWQCSQETFTLTIFTVFPLNYVHPSSTSAHKTYIGPLPNFLLYSTYQILVERITHKTLLNNMQSTCQFPKATAIKYRRLGASKRQKFILSQPGGQKSEIKAVAEPASLWHVQGRILHWFFQLLGTPDVPWLEAASFRS